MSTERKMVKGLEVRDMTLDEVSLVTRGANQTADMLIAKGDKQGQCKTNHKRLAKGSTCEDCGYVSKLDTSALVRRPIQTPATVMARVEKGDRPGHPFRGNQHTKGKGSGKKSTKGKPHGKPMVTKTLADGRKITVPKGESARGKLPPKKAATKPAAKKSEPKKEQRDPKLQGLHDGATKARLDYKVEDIGAHSTFATTRFGTGGKGEGGATHEATVSNGYTPGKPYNAEVVRLNTTHGGLSGGRRVSESFATADEAYAWVDSMAAKATRRR